MDIISQLSDDLLSRILSFVPISDVVATSILSKRWRCVWMLVSQLEYNDSSHNGDYKSFSQFVYRSLISNKSPVLEKLYLNVGADCPFIDIRLWIDIAVSRRVRELEAIVHFSKDGFSVSLPSSLYTSDTLETLTLNNYLLLDVPSSVFLPSLKVLHLKSVDYVDSTSLPSLLSGCPNLEELFVERHELDETMDAAIVVPSLQRLSMWDEHSGKGGQYVINCPSLKYLRVTQQFLKALTSVRHLSLCLPLSEVSYHSSMIFNQLVHLNLYTFAEGWWDHLTCMLQDSPKLRFLKLIDKHDSGLCGKETPIGWKPPNCVPECLLFSLEAFEWNGYKGRQGDREMSTYVLKNASYLKTATFSPESTDVGEKYQILKELASIPTASTSSQLLFD